MASFPPTRDKFVDDITPFPRGREIRQALVESLIVLANHRRWARRPDLFSAGDRVSLSPQEAYEREGIPLLPTPRRRK